MSDTVVLGRREATLVEQSQEAVIIDKPKSNVPSFETLQNQLTESSKLVDDIILKKYLHKLTDLEIVPLSDGLKQISDIRLFKITEMVYQKDEYSTYKFASVFNAVQNLNCSIFILADSNGQKTDFYMGVRSLDDKRTTKSLKDLRVCRPPANAPSWRNIPDTAAGTGSGIGKNVMLKTLLYGFEN